MASKLKSINAGNLDLTMSSYKVLHFSKKLKVIKLLWKCKKQICAQVAKINNKKKFYPLRNFCYSHKYFL